MPYITVSVDDLQSGQDVRGFAAEADLDVQYWGEGDEWVIRSATVRLRSNGKWVWRSAKPDLFREIRAEILSSTGWVHHINTRIDESLSERRYRMEDA